MVLPEPVLIGCHELIEEQHRRDILRSYNLEPRNRVLLAGEPGNGKTTLAEALAHALMVPFVVARYDGLIASYLGETASRLKKLSSMSGHGRASCSSTSSTRSARNGVTFTRPGRSSGW